MANAIMVFKDEGSSVSGTARRMKLGILLISCAVGGVREKTGVSQDRLGDRDARRDVKGAEDCRSAYQLNSPHIHTAVHYACLMAAYQETHWHSKRDSRRETAWQRTASSSSSRGRLHDRLLAVAGLR